ncbi:cytochrome c oxidase subunit CcoM [Litchfieldella rifensis]|uniref:Cytochrome c oxidase subunit CcoM n=1 Tax=Litchfieldella rifensis TaxID=762643 RepID=A0ABV7LNE9_9GAMM
MYWDEAVIFGLVTVGLMVAFMGGWISFIVRDHKRKSKQHKH